MLLDFTTHELTPQIKALIGLAVLNRCHTLDFAEADKIPVTDAASLLTLKQVLEETYLDGITALKEVYLEGVSFTGIFEDKVSDKLIKRNRFTVSENEVSYKLENPEDVSNFSEELVEFAAKAKNCVKGQSCGSSCISKNKECKKVPSAGAKKKVAELKKKAAGGSEGSKKPAPAKSKKPAPESTAAATKTKSVSEDASISVSTKDHRKLIAHGDSFTSKYLKPVDKSEEIKLEKIISEKSDHFNKISDAYENKQAIELDGKVRKVKKAEFEASREAVNAAYDNFNDAQRRREQKEDEQHAEILSAIKAHHKMSDFDIKEFTDMTEIKFDDHKLVANVQAYHKDFVALTGGKGHESLAYFEEAGGRAHASLYDQSINIGGGTKRTIFHELGHHVEYNNPNFNEAAIAFRTERATSKVPEKLSEITGRKGDFRDDEVALKGKYSSPYIGKVYDTHPLYENYTGRRGFAPTEVISVGFENFDSPKAMKKFYEEDKEHYNMTVAMMLAK
jgi:hypothetical protein